MSNSAGSDDGLKNIHDTIKKKKHNNKCSELCWLPTTALNTTLGHKGCKDFASEGLVLLATH